jgi:hypothetical protein
LNVQVVFHPDDQGSPDRLVVVEGDRKQKGQWVMPVRREHKVVAVDVEVLDRYVGHYRMTPTFALTVIRDDDRLFVQATHQLPLRIYPESELHFFSYEIDLQITFVLDIENRAANFILHQNGFNRVASREAEPPP